MSDPVLTTRDVARRMLVTDRTVRDWVKAGRLAPAFRTPTGQMRFLESQLAAAELQPSERAQDIEAHVTAAIERARLRRRGRSA